MCCCLQDLAEDARRFGANAKERLPGFLPDPEGLAMIQAQMVRRNPEVLDHVLRAIGVPELPALPAKVYNKVLQRACTGVLGSVVSNDLTVAALSMYANRRYTCSIVVQAQ